MSQMARHNWHFLEHETKDHVTTSEIAHSNGCSLFILFPFAVQPRLVRAG